MRFDEIHTCHKFTVSIILITQIFCPVFALLYVPWHFDHFLDHFSVRAMAISAFDSKNHTCHLKSVRTIWKMNVPFVIFIRIKNDGTYTIFWVKKWWTCHQKWHVWWHVHFWWHVWWHVQIFDQILKLLWHVWWHVQILGPTLKIAMARIKRWPKNWSTCHGTYKGAKRGHYFLRKEEHVFEFKKVFLRAKGLEYTSNLQCLFLIFLSFL